MNRSLATKPPLADAFWPPFSRLSRAQGERVKLVAGRGATLIDSRGAEYLDATAALWYSLIGHGRQEMADAIARQVSTLEACSCFDIFASDRTLELAERVAEMVPLDGARVFFTSGGSDSVDTAAKVVRRYWAEQGYPEKRTIIHREGSYHGTHAYGTSLAGIGANRDGFGELVRDTVQVPMFDPDELESQIASLGADRVAAFIAEPVIGAGGVHPPRDSYLQEVSRVCRRHDVLLIADEVITGFGRTGARFACERYGLTADVVILAKGLTSGYLPLGATVFGRHIAELFEGEDGPWLRHGYTYSGHATACAAALANLQIIEREDLVDRVAALEPRLEAILAPLRAAPGVAEVRTVGLTAGVQLSQELADPSIAQEVADGCRRRGVLTRLLAGGALQVSPPFVITEEELSRLAAVFADAIAEVRDNLPSPSHA